MDTNLRSITSDTVELIVDDGQLRFLVHKDILAAQSEPFRTATTGEWREATEGKINLVGWDGDTVGRLVEFLYTGDYTYPEPMPLEKQGQQDLKAPESSPSHPKDGTDTGETVRADSPSRESLLYSTRPLTPLNEQCRNDTPNTNGPKPDAAVVLGTFDPADHDYKEVILSHAKVYALAHYKSITPLRTLALGRFKTALYRLHPIQPNSHSASTVAHLARYVYGNTDYLANSEEALRRVVSSFVAMNILALQTTKGGVIDLVGEGGDLAKDIMAKVCRLFRGLERSTTISEFRFVSDIRVCILP